MCDECDGEENDDDDADHDDDNNNDDEKEKEVDDDDDDDNFFDIHVRNWATKTSKFHLKIHVLAAFQDVQHGQSC